MTNWKYNLIFLWIAQFFSIMGFSFAIPFAPFYLMELGISGGEEIRFWSGLFHSGTGFTMAFVTPFWGYLADKIGKKPMILRASLGGSAVLLGMGLSRSPEMLVFFRFLQGFFTGTITANLTMAVAQTPKEKMGFAVGLINSAVFVGNSISPLFGGIFADIFGYRQSFFIASGFLFFSFLINVVFIREQKSERNPEKASFSFFSDMWKLLFATGIFSIVGITALIAICRTLHRPMLPLLVKEMMSDSSHVATQTGLVTAAAGVSSVFAGLFFGNMADRGLPKKLGVMAALFSGFFVLPFTLATRAWHLIGINFIFTFFVSGLDSIIKVILARNMPAAKRGSAFGLLGSARSIGWAVGSLNGGIISALLGLRSVFFFSSGLFFAIVFIFMRLMKRVEEGG